MTNVLETSRLALRELDDGDLDFVAEVLGDPEVMRFWPRRFTWAGAQSWIERQRDRYAADGCGYWLLTERSGGVAVGQAGVLVVEIDGRRVPSLGYIVHRPFWRRGYATEAAAACMAWAFRELDADRVYTLIRPENEPSLGVARRLGMAALRRVTFQGYEHVLFACERPDRAAGS